MIIHVVPDRADTAAAAKLMSPKWFVAYIALLITFVCFMPIIGVVQALHAGSSLGEAMRYQVGSLVGLCFLIALFALVRWISPQLAARKLILRPVTWTLNDDGVRLESEVGVSELRWNAFLKYRESKKLYLLYVQKTQAHYIPKRSLTPSELEELSALLSAHIKKGK